MRFLLSAIIALILIYSASAGKSRKARKENASGENRLLDYLLTDYDPRARPVKNASKIVNVSFALTLQQIVDLDEKNQVITTSMYMGWSWIDEFLQWNPDDFEGIQDIRIPAKYAWKPDILIYNSAVSSFDQMLQTNVIVSHTGMVEWLPPGLFQTTCDVDIRYFPYDEQKCRIKFGTWTYHGGLVDLILTQEDAILDNFTPNGEYEFISMKGKRTSVKYECCPYPFVDITYTINIKRRILFYSCNLILPCLLICGLTILVFLLPADAGERITLGITILLALVVFLQLVTDSLPPADTIPLMVKFFACSIIMVTMSVVATVISLNFHHTNSANTDEMPYLIRLIFLDTLPSWLRMKRPGEHSYRRQFLDTPDSDGDSIKGINSGINGTRNSREELPLMQISRQEQKWGDTPTNNQQELTVLDNANKEMSSILQEVKFITDRMHNDDKDEISALEWQFAATVLDKFCIYLFSLYLILSTMFTIVLGPFLYA